MLYGRLYVVSFENVAVAAAQDLFMIAPATDKPIVLHSLTLSNVGGTADAGDAQEEDLRVTIVRGNATVGSGGGSASVVPKNALDTAASFTARINDTTAASTGTPVVLGSLGWNTRSPLDRLWAPEHRPFCSAIAAQTRVCVRLLSTPADSFQVSGELLVEEIG